MCVDFRCYTNISRAGNAVLALELHELSQTLKEHWLTADYRAKRRLFETPCLNFFLRDVNLDVTLNKPFDVLVEGLDSAENRGDRI